MWDQSMNEVLQTVGPRGLDAADRLDLADLTLDLRREELRDATGARIELRNRSFSILRHLATNADRVVTKDELLEANWPGVTVTEDSLTQCISEIRRALGQAGRELIRTVPRRGYIVILPERSTAPAQPLAAPDAATSPRILDAVPRCLRRTVAVPALLAAAALTVCGVWIAIGGVRS